MLYSHVDDIALKVARKLDELVEACLVLLGMDKRYVVENHRRFRVELYPEGRRVYYQDDMPLFLITESVEFDLEGYTAIISHEVRWLCEREEVIKWQQNS